VGAAVIDVRKSFMPGMGYMGSSRGRHLDDIYLVGINKTLRLNPGIVQLHRGPRSHGWKPEPHHNPVRMRVNCL
jgi:hypothetical protein